jgi:hypothetical protein
VQDFDRALALQPQLRPYLWQRGLSLYYLGEFQEAATQFRCAIVPCLTLSLLLLLPDAPHFAAHTYSASLCIHNLMQAAA